VSVIQPTLIHELSSGFNAVALDSRSQWRPPSAGQLVNSETFGTKTDTQPIAAEPADAKQGSVGLSFGHDWYNRIHVTPRTIDLGNVVSDQVYTITVWNAYTDQNRVLNAVTGVDTEGINLTEPAPTPMTYRTLQEETYEVDVTTSGPPVIDASYTFDFDSEDVKVELGGNRVTAWLWEPNWRSKVTERLEWLTDVMVSYNGKEQRVKVRNAPRSSVEFEALIKPEHRRDFEAALWNWQARVWALPVWTEGNSLSAPIAAGATSLNIDTRYRRYKATGLAIIIDGMDFELVEISGVTDSTLSLTRSVLSDWTTRAKVYPVRVARLPAQQSLRRNTSEVATGVFKFDLVNPETVGASTSVSYLGYPVLEHKSNWKDVHDADYERKLLMLDYMTGVRAYEDESGIASVVETHNWTLPSLADIDAFRRFAYERSGRLVPLWLPTFSSDFTLTATVGSTSTSLDVEHNNYVRHYGVTSGRRDLRIELNDGTIFYRRILGATELDSNTERLSLNSALGIEVQPADVRKISFMSLCRLDADTLEFAWHTAGVAEVKARLRSIRDDV